MLTSGALLQNRYHIRQPLGGGGMGMVYLGEDTRLPGRRCAIKEVSPAQLPPQDQAWAVATFRQEAELLATLHHPGLTAVTDFFPEQGNWYLVMDFVEGETLEARLQRTPGGRLPPPEALTLARQLCGVLEYLHHQHPPVVFRDLKPGNVMLTPQNQVKLIDFGIARFFKPGQTQDTVNLGTPGYAAPEQYGGKGQTDPRSDVYSLGVLLHQLLTGYDPTTTPFHLPPARTLNANLTPDIESAVRKAIEMQPAMRFQSVPELRQALFPIAQDPTINLSPNGVAPRNSRMWLGLGSIAVVFVAVILLWLRSGLPVSSSAPASKTAPSATATVEPTAPAMPTSTFTPPASPSPTPANLATTQDLVLGFSAGGRNISMVQIGYAGGPAIVIVGSIEGDQADTSRTVDDLVDWYRSRPDDVPNAATLYLIRSINPDGNANGSRYNQNGVDLNRNWQTGNWRSHAPVPEQPRGKSGAGGGAPFSEQETQVLRDLLIDLRDAGRETYLIVLHSTQSSGRGAEVFSGYTATGIHPASDQLTREVGGALGYRYSRDWDYETTGEAIGWCGEQDIPSVDIVSARGRGPALDQMIQVLQAISN